MPSSALGQAPLGQGDWLPPRTEAEGLLCCLSGIVAAGPPEHLSSFWLVSTCLSFLTPSVPVGASLHRSLWSCWTGSMTAKVCLKADRYIQPRSVLGIFTTLLKISACVQSESLNLSFPECLLRWVHFIVEEGILQHQSVFIIFHPEDWLAVLIKTSFPELPPREFISSLGDSLWPCEGPAVCLLSRDCQRCCVSRGSAGGNTVREDRQRWGLCLRRPVLCSALSAQELASRAEWLSLWPWEKRPVVFCAGCGLCGSCVVRAPLHAAGSTDWAYGCGVPGTQPVSKC